MTRTEVQKRIDDARDAIRQYKAEGLQRAVTLSESEEVQNIVKASEMLISEARTIGAAGRPCPACGGSGRI